MTFASSDAVALRYIAEVTWGTTPATPALQALRYTSEGLNYNADFITSEEMRADRMTADTVQVSSSAAGPINGELSYATYDDFIDTVMYEDWYTTATAEGAQTDISITKTGGTPNTWTVDSAALANFSDNNFVVGQFIRVNGFAVAGTFFARITSIATLSLGIEPLSDVASEIAGDSVTVTPMEHVRNGTTRKSLTIQKEFTDLTTPEFWNFTGSRAGNWTLELATGSILNTSFDMLCKDAAMTETQFAGASVVAANTNDVMNAVNNIAGITFDGDPGAAQFFFSSLSISINNNLRGQEAIGTLGFIGVEAGRLNITGSIELYFEDSTLFDKFRAATAFQLYFRAADAAGNSYVFNIPRAKYTSMDITAGGTGQDVFASAEFEGIINAAGTFQFQVSRLVA
jgi:hypothetical protein